MAVLLITRKNFILNTGFIVMLVVLLLSVMSCVSSDDDDSGPLSCYHPSTSITGNPFGINLDPVRSEQLGVGWDEIFEDIDYLRAGRPFWVRITFRAQWMQDAIEWDEEGNLTVIYDTGEGSTLASVQRLYDYIQNNYADSVSILGILYGTPSFNSLDGSHGPGVPIYVEVWEDFVRKMVQTFPQISSWEIWNEPDLDLYWHGSVEDFALSIYNPARDIIEQYHPSAQIVAPSWAQVFDRFSFEPSEGRPYPQFGWSGSVDQYIPGRGDLLDFYSLIGGRDAFDIWGIHAYANHADSDEEWSSEIQSYACHWDIWLEELSGESYRIVPMWITEVGIENRDMGIGEEQASDYFEYFIEDQYYAYNDESDTTPNFFQEDGWDPNAQKMIVYELYDEQAFDPEGGRSGFFRNLHVPKPAAEMMRQKIDGYYSTR